MGKHIGREPCISVVTLACVSWTAVASSSISFSLHFISLIRHTRFMASDCCRYDVLNVSQVPSHRLLHGWRRTRARWSTTATNASRQVGERVAVVYGHREQVSVALVGRRTRTYWPWSKRSGSARRGLRDWEVRGCVYFYARRRLVCQMQRDGEGI
jgi:hypothetical protein